jgi:hypothetical protein
MSTVNNAAKCYWIFDIYKKGVLNMDISTILSKNVAE